MKTIDKTPLHDDKGAVSFSARIQGTLKYGLSWFSDLEAQKKVITQLDRTLEKGYVLIRNFTLPGSEILIPIILIGPRGIQVITVTQVKGFFEAKGDQWNTVSSGRSQPASINLLDRVAKYGRALQRYMQIQHIDYPEQVEPVLIMADPGAHVESMRPVARVVMSDAIKQFGVSVMQDRPVLRSEQVYEISERIVTPRSPEQRASAQPVQSGQNPLQPPARVAELAPAAVSQQPVPASRSQAIFKSEQKPFDPNDLGFAFEDGPGSADQSIPPHLRESGSAQPLPQSAPKNRIMGMTMGQIAFLAGILVFWCCAMIGLGGYIYYLTQ